MKYLLLAFTILLLLATCRKDNTQTITMPVCFDSDILPVFKNSCAKSGCHDALTQEAGYRFDTYEGILKGVVKERPERSAVYKAICLKRGKKAMPPAPVAKLSESQINRIGAWIRQGAQNTSNCNFNCDTFFVRYSFAVKALMNKYCTGCHNTSTPAANLDLTTYADVSKIALNGKLMGTVEFRSGYLTMPPDGNKLSPCEISQIRNWVNDGAINN